MEFNATFAVTVISFLVFVFLMNAILYRPLENIVEEREKLLADNCNDADNAKKQAESLLKQKAELIAKSKIEAKRLIDAKIKEGYDRSAETVKNARLKSMEFLKEQKNMLESQSRVIEQNFEAESFAAMIKDKILGAEVRNA